MISPRLRLPDGLVRVRPAVHVDGVVEAPGSKSMTIRTVVLAAVADGRSILHGALDAEDTRAVRAGMSALGAEIESAGGTLDVQGKGGRLTAGTEPIDCLLSGTTLRLLTGMAVHADGPVTLTGAAPLLRRPVGPLVGALRQLGAALRDEDGHPPVHTSGGGLAGGVVEVDVSRSSQFASAVLVSAPLADAPVEVRAVGRSAHAYIDLTVDALRIFGVEVEEGDGWWRVRPGVPRAGNVRVEHDASATCHLLAVAVATGGRVTVTNAGPTRQPDARLTEVFRQMGAEAVEENNQVTVTGPADIAPVEVDLSDMPDQVTTVAALAALADGESHLTGVGVTRGHETDRLAALARELPKLGVEVDEEPDALWIRGGAAAGPARLATYDDHRLAMAFAAVASAVDGLVIEDAGCVAKTYPAFWQDLALLGVEWNEVDDPGPQRPDG